ncbi:MAG TPA: hypothetical protein DF383_00655 [Deltaproteobacteria bacterium]|nr:hypothetical protein [Deltaproteobacteria bacterium]
MGAKLRQILVLFLVGAVFGPLGDAFHVISGTNDYPQGVFGLYLWRQPWWVPLVFGSAALAIGLSHPQLDHWLHAPAQRRGSGSILTVIYGVAAFLVVYAMTAFVPLPTGGWLDITIATAALFVWFDLDRTWQGLVLAAMTAGVGTAVEITMVHQGYFSYLPPKNNFYGVPSWLPWLYVSASVGVGNLGRFLSRSSHLSH